MGMGTPRLFRAFKNQNPFVPNPNHRPVQFDGMMGSAVIRCTCGNPNPIMVPFVPGAMGAAATCGNEACQITWGIKEVSYTIDQNGMPHLKVEFSRQQPAILPPSGPLPPAV